MGSMRVDDILYFTLFLGSKFLGKAKRPLPTLHRFWPTIIAMTKAISVDAVSFSTARFRGMLEAKSTYGR
jgi:hypothetical protein